MPGSFMAETSDGINLAQDMFAWHWFMIMHGLKKVWRVSDLYNDDVRWRQVQMADADQKTHFCLQQ